MPLKLIFMGTPEFAVPILKSIKESKHKILSVYTQPPKKSRRGQKLNKSPIHQYSLESNLDIRCPDQINDQKELEYIKKIKPDVIVVVAYGKILAKELLSIERLNFLNIHASLLPRWRGAAPIQRALMEMDKETGISIMKIVSKLDAGPFMLQEKINIEKKDDFISLSNKLSKLGSKLILKSLDIIEAKNQKFKDQNENEATYANKITKEETKVNWKIPANKIIAKIKGLSPFPGVWFNHEKTRLKIIEAVEVQKSGKPGEVIENNLTIACGNNSIKILSIQKEGKKILSAEKFLAGYNLQKGENLI